MHSLHCSDETNRAVRCFPFGWVMSHGPNKRAGGKTAVIYYPKQLFAGPCVRPAYAPLDPPPSWLPGNPPCYVPVFREFAPP